VLAQSKLRSAASKTLAKEPGVTGAPITEVGKLSDALSRLEARRDTMRGHRAAAVNKRLGEWGSSKKIEYEARYHGIRRTAADRNAKKAQEWYSQVVSADDYDARMIYDVHIHDELIRAYAESQWSAVHLNKTSSKLVHVHEIGHLFEAQRFGAHKATMEFFSMRVAKSAPVRRKFISMRKAVGGRSYKVNEYVIREDFDKIFPNDKNAAHYMGKLYLKRPQSRAGQDMTELLQRRAAAKPGVFQTAGAVPSTEIVSMGFQELSRDASLMATRDPEACKFFLGLLDGTLL